MTQAFDTAKTIHTHLPLTGGTLSGNVTGVSFTGSLIGNADSSTVASKLQTARNISLTGDVSWSQSFDGSGNVTGTATLQNTGVVAGTYNTTTHITSYTVDSKGRISAVGAPALIQPEWTQITNKPTTWTGCFGNSAISVDDISTRLDTGSFQTANAQTINGWPLTTNSWMHLASFTHDNSSNYYAMQFSGSFYSSADVFYRVTNNNGNSPWAKLWNSLNDGASSGLDADLLDGQEGSWYQNRSNHTGTQAISTITNLQTSLDSKATTGHKYHEFNIGEYFFDYFYHAKFFRLFTENSASDLIRARPISDVEYHDGTSWVPWVGGDSAIRLILDGNETTFAQIGHAQRRFRFTVDAYSGWPLTTLFVMQSSWTAITYPSVNVSVEKAPSNTGPWALRDSAVFGNGTTGNDWGVHSRVMGNLHNGETYTRITVDITDWVDNSTYTTFPVCRLMMLSNYIARKKTPMTWDYSENVWFPQNVTGRVLISDVATGTAPFTVSSTTRVPNLNVATAGTADTLTTPRTINGVSFNGSSNITINATDSTARIAVSEKGTANGVATLDATTKIPIAQIPTLNQDTTGYADRIISMDTRNVVDTPQSILNGLHADFKSNGIDGLSDGGTYHGVLSFRQYSFSGGQDWSGGGVRQLGFTDNHNLWIRGANADNAWSSWKRFYNSDDATTANTASKIVIRDTDSSIQVGDVRINSMARIKPLTITTTATSEAILLSLAHGQYGSIKTLIQANTGSERHVTEVLVTHNGIDAYLTEYGTIWTGTRLFNVTADISGTDIRIKVTSTSATSTVYRSMNTLLIP